MDKAKKAVKKTAKAAEKKQEDKARRQVLEELFYDFHQSRSKVYRMNFVRGIYFGFGSIIGGSLFVALFIGLLTILTDIPGGIGDFVQYIVDTVEDSDNS